MASEAAAEAEGSASKSDADFKLKPLPIFGTALLVSRDSLKSSLWGCDCCRLICTGGDFLRLLASTTTSSEEASRLLPSLQDALSSSSILEELSLIFLTAVALMSWLSFDSFPAKNIFSFTFFPKPKGVKESGEKLLVFLTETEKKEVPLLVGKTHDNMCVCSSGSAVGSKS